MEESAATVQEAVVSVHRAVSQKILLSGAMPVLVSRGQVKLLICAQSQSLSRAF